MKTAKTFGLSMIAIATLVSSSLARAGEAERIFESGLFQLRDTYNSVRLRIPSSAPYRDIKMGCVGSVFLEWQNAYLEVMKRTTLTLSSMALQDYGTFMVNVDASQRALNTGRWGMVDRTRQEIDQRRAQVSGYPQGTRGLTFSGETIHRETLITNLVPCMDAEFGKLIDEDVPQPDLSRLDTTAYKVTWKQSTAGGIEAEWIKIEGGGDQRLLLFGIGQRSIHETMWNALTTGSSR